MGVIRRKNPASDEPEYCEVVVYRAGQWQGGGPGSVLVRRGQTWDLEAGDVVEPPPAVAPSVVVHPLSRTVVAGVSVEFTAAANGTAPITVQWQRNTTGSWVNISAATSTTYTLLSAQASDVGSYRAVFTNSAGSATSNAATLAVNVAGAAYLDGSTGLVLAGVPGAHASIPHTAALAAQNWTSYELVVYATSADWSAYHGDEDGGTVQVLAAKSNGGTNNERSWDLAVGSVGDPATSTQAKIIADMSSTGTGWNGVLVGVPAPNLSDGGRVWFRSSWTKSTGLTEIHRAAGTSLGEAVGDVTWGTAVATGTKLANLALKATTAPLRIGATNERDGNNGVSAPFKGTIHYVRLKANGVTVVEWDARLATAFAETDTEDANGYTVTIHQPAGTTNVAVGMPNGEAANVGPTAAVLGHTPISYDDLDAQVPTKVLTTAIVNALGSTETTDDGTLRRVVPDNLNVLVSVQSTSTTPVLLRDAKVGQVIGGNGSDVWIEWADIGKGWARDGDEDFTDPDIIWDGTRDVNPTTASINGATTWGTGGDTISLSSDGKFTTAGLLCQVGTKLTAYRCNIWGNEDAAFVFEGSSVTLKQCWIHDHFWVPRDASRKNKTPPNTHYDIVKCSEGDLLVLDGCRIDQWPIIPDDYADLVGPAWKGPHWGKNPNNTATWPAVRNNADGTTTVHVGTAGIISNQVTGTMKNILVTDCIITGPVNVWFDLGNNGAGTTWQRNVTIRRCRFYSGVTSTLPTPWVQPRTAMLRPSGNGLQTSDNWNWPITGPDVNYFNDVPITTHPRSNMNDSSDFTPS